jgi:hypothetical protein
MSNSKPTFIGWPTEGIDFWNGYWRRRAEEGFFDDPVFNNGFFDGQEDGYSAKKKRQHARWK